MHSPPNIALFSVVLGIVFVLADIYVLTKWSSFVRSREMNKWLRWSGWIVSAAMLMIYLWVAYRRHTFRLDGFDVTLFGVLTFWYIPKLIIVPVLLVGDFFKLLRKLSSQILEEPPQSSISVPSRRRFVSNAAWTAAGAPFVLVGNGMWSTLYDFKTYRIDMPIPRLPRSFDGMTILQISDIHAGSFPDHRPFQEVGRIVADLKPDAIVITGDFINANPRELSVIARELAKLKAPHGVFASLGNHDHYHDDTDHNRLLSGIRSLNVDLLVNENRRIQIGDSSLIIAGTDNSGFRQQFANIGEALHGVEDHEPVILLAHDPTFWDAEVVGKSNVDVMLSGHTHGGQFGLQLLGFEWSPAKYVYKQWAGLYSKGSQKLYVNRGIGTVGPPLRVGIPPEITLFTLRSVA